MQIDRGNVFVSAFAPSTMKRRQWLDEAATNEMIKGKNRHIPVDNFGYL